MEQVSVDLGDRGYTIYIGENLFTRAGEILKRGGVSGKVMVITNPTVGDLYSDDLYKGLGEEGFEVSSEVVPDGEEYKTLESAKKLYDSLVDNRMDRDSTVVALGGGVIGDLAGFVAATFKRGLPFVQVPTTLLAQVDASVGGKVAVDHPRGKNMIGSFYQPRCVLISLNVLETLPAREMKGGLAEVIKYGVIRDRHLFEFVEEHLDQLLARETDATHHIVKRSCEIKASVVGRDERDQGLRTILNYGHTIGHAIEAAAAYRQYRHGEAVAIGMICATDIAVRLKFASIETLEKITALIERTKLPTSIKDLCADEIMNFLFHDKKVHQGKIRFVLPKRIGDVVITDTVPQELIKEILNKYSL